MPTGEIFLFFVVSGFFFPNATARLSAKFGHNSIDLNEATGGSCSPSYHVRKCPQNGGTVGDCFNSGPCRKHIKKNRNKKGSSSSRRSTSNVWMRASVWERPGSTVGHFVTFRPTKAAIRPLLHLFLTSGDTEEDSEQSAVFGPRLNDGDESESAQMSQWILLAASHCWREAVMGGAPRGGGVLTPFHLEYGQISWIRRPPCRIVLLGLP